MNRKLKVPAGKDVVILNVTGHTYVRLLDEGSRETFRFQSPGKHVTAVVKPGSYIVETDGKLGKLRLTSLEPRFRRAFDWRKPPRPTG